VLPLARRLLNGVRRMAETLHITLFTLGIALLSTVLILPPGIALGWLLARRRWPGKALVETLVALPLVIPPVATGLVLLKVFGKHGTLGALCQRVFGVEIVFTWKAVVIATASMSLPLLVRAARVAFEEVPERLEQVARTLGAGPWRTFFAVSLPLARRGLAAGTVMAFARALGEFGATVMVAGMIPGETVTLALGIYHEVQLGHDGPALVLLGVSVALAFAALATSEWLLRRKEGERRKTKGESADGGGPTIDDGRRRAEETPVAGSRSDSAERLRRPATTEAVPSLALDSVRWTAGEFVLEVSARFGGGATGLFGVSGSGKSTVVELVAGLRRPLAGRILLGATVLDDVESGIHVQTHERRIGFVPQDGALFPHLSVAGNLRFAERRAPKAGRDERRAQVCALLGIAPLLGRRVAGLSGGERQRVALARALVSAPRLLLLDEPLAALDAARKQAILPYLRRVRDELGLPMLFVSHAREEVLALCDELAVLADGRLLQHGPVAEVFRRPTSDAVARIVGVETVLPGRLLGGDGALVAVDVAGVRVHGMGDQLPAGSGSVLVSIRAEEVLLVRANPALETSARNRWRGTVVELVDEGAMVRVELDCGFPLVARLTRQAAAELALDVGTPVVALVKAPSVHLMAR
jgi:molybdate transport system permease protein